MRIWMLAVAMAASTSLPTAADPVSGGEKERPVPHGAQAAIRLLEAGLHRTYELSSTGELRDNRPAEGRVVFSEPHQHARLRTGNLMFDGLYALAVHEALQNSVGEIKDGAYGHGTPVELEAFQTGELWPYVWTRDLAYSAHLSLAGFDPQRAVNSLLFKTSPLKAAVLGGHRQQIMQDTGSGGSYPVSTDRIVWALGASAALKYLHGAQRDAFLREIYPILRDTIEQDRQLVFDPQDGLYRGEQSFLDWREQSYPAWTSNDVLPIALSKTLSVNAANYFLLRTAAEYASRLDREADEVCYAAWAEELKVSINEHLWSEQAGLYSTYRLSDGITHLRVNRYDLLGESLAILFDVADPRKAQRILAGYPVGPHGPPVLWPQERTMPIYHNQAIWPFVTAYWVKAARHAGHWRAVDHGIDSLQRLAALNLSNMENFDFVTGSAQVSGAARNGPVINSRRQLWSVAGYLSMVQDVVFGLETSWEGIRFRPFLTARLRNQTFAANDMVEWRNFTYHGILHTIRLHLPPPDATFEGVCAVERVELNGKVVPDDFMHRDALQVSNQWDIRLRAPEVPSEKPVLRLVGVEDERSYCGPAPPVWLEGDDLEQMGASAALRFDHPDMREVVFNIYRDGELCAGGLRERSWRDPLWAQEPPTAHAYTVEAVDPKTGNVSHPSPILWAGRAEPPQVIPARAMRPVGGQLVAGHHFENWGQPHHELAVPAFQVKHSGTYAVRAEFSNGSGPVNTGITCGLKRLEVRELASGEVVACGYWIMPQSGDWKRWDLSSPVLAKLSAGKEYALRIHEDALCRNMSCLERNERYTAWPGGGPLSYNYVNIASVQLMPLTPARLLAQAE